MGGEGRLRRLKYVWDAHAVYFITTCCSDRKPILANDFALQILCQELLIMRERHGWAIGRYVIMPDHVHFFATRDSVEGPSLSQAIGRWKEWTAKKLIAANLASTPVWQVGFFDHLLRSNESRSEKWNYVWQNPVRAGLVAHPEDWPYSGSVDFE